MISKNEAINVLKRQIQAQKTRPTQGNLLEREEVHELIQAYEMAIQALECSDQEHLPALCHLGALCPYQKL